MRRGYCFDCKTEFTFKRSDIMKLCPSCGSNTWTPEIYSECKGKKC